MQKIKGFDGIRGISVLLVILMHLGLGSVLEAKGVPSGFYEAFSGDVGVRIFFVLSGFLITSILWNEIETSGSIQLGKFYMRRALRLLPAMSIFALLILITIQFGGMKADWISFSYAFLYAYNYIPIVHYQTELATCGHLVLRNSFTCFGLWL